jgi:hypothetical protein
MVSGTEQQARVDLPAVVSGGQARSVLHVLLYHSTPSVADGIPELLGGPQWVEYKQHALRRCYREWLLFFQRRPGKASSVVVLVVVASKHPLTVSALYSHQHQHQHQQSNMRQR